MYLRNTLFRLHPCAPCYMCSGDGLEMFESAPRRAPCVVYFHPPWYVGWRYALRIMRKVRNLKRKGVRVVICCNERGECFHLSMLNVENEFLNQNMHLPESVFRPIEVDLRYEAVYAARASKFKRVHLASMVSKLFIITYACPNKDTNGRNDLHGYEPRVSHCEFNRNFIDSHDDLCRIYSSSSCGLALSAKEGAMWASMEYLMCGLPVVTTRNIGGRDFYLHEDYAKWVDPDPNSIYQAVCEFVNCPIDRRKIRNSVLKLVKGERVRFLQRCNNDLIQGGHSLTSYDYIWGGISGIYDNREEIKAGSIS